MHYQYGVQLQFSILLKQLCHLSLRQPHRLVLQSNIDLSLTIFRLIDYNLLIFFHTLFVSFAKIHLIFKIMYV